MDKTQVAIPEKGPVRNGFVHALLEEVFSLVWCLEHRVKWWWVW